MFLFSSSPAAQWMFFSWKEGRGDFLYQRNWYSWKNRPVCTQPLQGWAAAGSSRFFFSSGLPVWDGQDYCGCDHGKSQTLWSLTSYTVVFNPAGLCNKWAASLCEKLMLTVRGVVKERTRLGWWSQVICLEWLQSWMEIFVAVSVCSSHELQGRVIFSCPRYGCSTFPWNQSECGCLHFTLIARSGSSECDLTGRTLTNTSLRPLKHISAPSQRHRYITLM